MGSNHNLGGHQRQQHKKALWKRQKGICHYCGQNMKKHGNEKRSATLDHVIPKSKGGVNARWNLVLCCMQCNTRKGDAWLEESVDSEGLNPSASNGVMVQAHHQAPQVIGETI